MKKSKKNLIIIISSLILLTVLTLVGIMVYNSSLHNYSFSEKKWMSDNSKNIIDIHVDPMLPVFSYKGNGVYMDFLKDAEKDTKLSFNIVYDAASDYSLSIKNKITKDDLVFYEDHFIVVSNSKIKINNLSELKNYKIGVLSKDASDISYYLTDYPSVSLTNYETIDDLNSAFDSSAINAAIVPMYEYMNKIITSSLNISYHLGSLKNYYTLKVNPNNKELSSIFSKFLSKWKNKANEKINEHFLDLYYEIKDYTELEKESIINDDLIVGYIDNMPFEGKVNGTFTGVTGLYLNKFSSLTSATYKYIRYKDINKLVGALDGEKVDIAHNYYGATSGKYANSITLGNSEYVVLASKDSNLIVDTLHSLKGKEIVTLGGRNLRNKLAEKNIFTIIEYPDIKKLLKKVDKHSIIILEKEVYDYYKTNKLKKYNIRFTDTIVLNNTFLLSQKNKPLSDLYNFYLTTLNPSEINTLALNQSLKDLHTNVITSFLVDNILYIIAFGLLVLFVLHKFNKRIKITKKIKKEDKMMYLDVMTNLKNRNYLNDNIEYWEKNIVFPQTIIMVDLNNIKALNDKYGHEEGDAQIVAASNVLIRNQRDNSEIIRTDGNEFLIYMIGYEEKVILSYIHKINKEIKSSLPYKDYGVAVGYSMIRSEVETIDDAINEASLMMRNNKEASREA
ncbi:MAG: GGDEF domain-containing protein [Bacilli bacterium]